MDRESLDKLTWSQKNINPMPDEEFRFMSLTWDIDSLLKRVEELDLPLHKINPADFESWFGLIGIDKEYAMNSEKDDPLLLIEVKPNQFMLADGYHRAYRDYKKGLTESYCVRVPFEEHIKYTVEKRMFMKLIEMAKESL